MVMPPETLRPLPATFARSGRAASLSHSAVIEASILARLLGIRLLRLNARIDMMPIDADRVAVAAERSATMPMTETVPMIGSSALPVVPGAPAGSSGTLADAADLLQHASRTLVEVRRERVARR
jgi:hypothetical protein